MGRVEGILTQPTMVGPKKFNPTHMGRVEPMCLTNYYYYYY